MFSTKYCSMFSWNSGSIKVASALDLVSILVIMLIMVKDEDGNDDD